MFRQSVSETPFSGEMADAFYEDKIIGDNFYADVTFLSTMRAVLSDRIGDDKISLFIRFFVKSNIDTAIELPSNALLVYNVSCNSGTASEVFQSIADYFSNCPGMEMQKKITEFFKPSFRALNYIDRVNKTSLLFVENLSFRSMRYVQRVLLALLPWYFDKEVGMTDDERELFNSLTKDSPEEYLAICERMAKKYDFRTGYLKKALGDFSKRYLVEEKNCVEKQIEDSRELVAQCYETIQQTLISINELGIRKLGLEESIRRNDFDYELLGYFSRNKSLSLLSAEGKCIRFCVADYLTYFDEDLAERFINNKCSVVYQCFDQDVSEDDIEKLTNAIFIDRLLKVRFYASYELDIRGSVRSLGRVGIANIEKTAMTNPHIARHNCLGTHIGPIITALQAGDLVVAIEQCAASARSLNFADGVVMGDFFGDLSNGWRCIELPDGRVVDFRKAIAFLNECELGG